MQAYEAAARLYVADQCGTAEVCAAHEQRSEIRDGQRDGGEENSPRPFGLVPNGANHIRVHLTTKPSRGPPTFSERRPYSQFAALGATVPSDLQRHLYRIHPHSTGK